MWISDDNNTTDYEDGRSNPSSKTARRRNRDEELPGRSRETED